MTTLFVCNQFNRLVASAALAEANRKFQNGDGITDEELDLLITAYRQMEGFLTMMGTTYHLAWAAININLGVLERFQTVRKCNRQNRF